MQKKHVLFIFRYDALQTILQNSSASKGPTEFLWGMNHIDITQYDIRCVNAPRLEKRTGLRRLTWFLEFPFAKTVRIGLPVEIYTLFYTDIQWADTIVCVNDQISLGVLWWRLLGRLRNKKIVCIIMSLPERIKYFSWCRPMVWVVSALLRRANVILTLSNVVQKQFAHTYSLSQTPLRTLHFGIDTSFWYSETTAVRNPTCILTAGNDMNRDYDTLLLALPDTTKLVAITKRSLETTGKNCERRSGITDEELRTLYQGAGMVVVPSIRLEHESSGLSVTLQAMACGAPVIVSDAPPLREMFTDGEHCLFYEPENADDLRAKILLLTTDATLREKIARGGYQITTERFTCKQMGKQLEFILGEV